MKKSIIIALLILLGSAPLAAQDGLLATEAGYHYSRGIELYEYQRYEAAQAEFRKAYEAADLDDGGVAMRSSYYIAQCAARASQPDARQLLESFQEEYPNSIYLNDTRFSLGLLQEKEGDYAGAYATFQSVDPYALEFSRLDEYNYRTGHAAYQAGETEKAYSYFRQVNTDPGFIPHATYYKGYIDYARGDLDEAKREFSSIASVPAYEPIIPFYLLQIEFQQGNYDYVIEHGLLLDKTTGSRRAEIARMLSESYFHKAAYADALRYIQQYEELGGAMGREELYLAGFCNYDQLYFNRAVDQLSAVASADDELGQNAAFHLGDSYLQLQDKRKALGAFALASSADFNPAVQEEAMFNYGKLQYEQGGGAFGEAITILDKYVKTFPNSPRIDEAREILLAAYFNSHNYEAAYDAIQSVRNPDNNVKTAMQKIAYFRGLEFFEQGDYPQALKFFDIADANRFNPKYTALTRFWRAETLVREQKYTQAIPLYKEYINLSPKDEYENKVANYNLGYCYFNTKQWDAAGASFDKFLSVYTPKDNLRGDTYNRLGDIAFAKREHTKAIEDYDQAIRLGSASSDYARFQRAVVQGLSGKRDNKIDVLKSIVASGKGDYVDDALYELGRTYVQTDRFTEGAASLKSLVEKYPSSPYYLSALAELGLTYQNLGNENEALRYYKQVVEKFPNSRQAQDAMLGIRNIYVDRNDVDSYFAYAKQAGVETSSGALERDSLSFAAAERVYQSGNSERALTLMDNYLGQYPKGVYRADALYALGDCSLQQGNRAGALAAFEEVASLPSNKYKEQALQRAAKMRAEDGNHAEAAALYHELSKHSSRSAVVSEALTGYLRETVSTGNTPAISQAASEVLVSSFVTDDLTREAHFAQARVAQQEGRNDEALRLYRQVTPARTREGAESRYRIAELLYSRGDLPGAEKEVYALSEANTPYQYWMGKAFLLLGDIYVKKNDHFQAKATYQSIVDGYADQTDGVVAEAREKLSTLK